MPCERRIILHQKIFSQGDLVQFFQLCTIYIECNLGLNLRFENISINWIMEDVVFVFCLILVVALCSIALRACFVIGMPKRRMGKDIFPLQYLSVYLLLPSVATGNELPGYPEIPRRGYPAQNRFFEICHYPDPARNRVLLPGGYPGN